MLQADYEKLPNFPIPSHVCDARESVETAFGPVTVYRFDEGHIGLWWRAHGQLQERLMPVVEGRGLWNTEAQAWHIPAENASGILSQIRSL